MPYTFETQRRVVQGNRAIVLGTERNWGFGPAEGRWYIGFLIFGILILTYHLGWPWVYETATGRSWRIRQESAVSLPAGPVWTPVQPPPAPPQVTVNVPDHVNVRIEPPPTPAPEPTELSPEELARRHTEALRRRGQ